MAKSIKAAMNSRFLWLLEDTFLIGLRDVEIKEPNAEMGHNSRDEEIVGEMSELERRCYSLSHEYGKTAGFMMLKAEYDAPPSEHEMLIERAQDSMNQSKCLKELMWALIRERLSDQIGERAIGVRTEFRIVAFEGEDEKRSHPVAKILGLKL